MDIVQQSLAPHREMFRRVFAYARIKKTDLYLVGGFVRDIYLGRHKQDPDIDLCMARGAIPFGRGLAKHLKCGFVVLDEMHGCCRLVLRTGSTYTIDISDFRGPTLTDDLALRDFTINSVCLALSDAVNSPDPAGSVMDLYGGRLDIKRRRLRLMYKKAFDDDPLRLLRAFSLSAVFDLSIEPECLSAIRRARKLLARVSAERIREELFKIFGTGNSCACLRDLDRHGILEIVFPEIKAMKRARTAGTTRIDIWQHTLDTVDELEKLCRRLARNADIAGYLNEPLAGGRNVYALMKLTALLHDAGKPATFKVEDGRASFYGHERVGSRMVAEIARRLRLSNDEQRWLSRITFLHLRPGYMATMPAVTARAIFRFFRDGGTESVAILLLALADERATSGYEVVEKIRPRYERLIFRLVRLYFYRKKASPRKRLVTGHDIMRLGSMPPSEAVGAILRELDELQAVRGITTRSAALACAKRLIKKGRNDGKDKAERV